MNIKTVAYNVCSWLVGNCRDEPLTQRRKSYNEKKRSERRKHCALAVVTWSRKFSLRRRPFPGAQDGQNLISWWWSLPSPTDPVWWKSMHANIAVTDPHRPLVANTHTGPITIHCAAKLSMQAWTGHCAIVHRRPPSTNTGAPWPLRNFLTCALWRKILLSLWPLAYAGPGRDDY